MRQGLRASAFPRRTSFGARARQALIGVLSKGAILGDVHDIKAEKVVPGVTLCAFETSYHP